METDTDLRHSVTLGDNRSVAGTPGLTPVETRTTPYGALDTYGLPAHRSGPAFSGGDMVAGLFVLLIILGPLVSGAMHAH